MSTEEQPDFARVCSGDPQALADFLTSRRPQLMAFIDRRLGTALRRKVEPDDLFQDMSAEAIRTIADAKLDGRDPFNWLCQLVERRIIDAHRRFFGSQKRNAAREISLNQPAGGVADSSHPGIVDLLVVSMTSASQAFSRDQKQIRMLAALAQLPDDHREALQLRYLEGLPSKEIADRLGKSDGAVRVMLTRALAKLQQIVGEQ